MAIAGSPAVYVGYKASITPVLSRRLNLMGNLRYDFGASLGRAATQMPCAGTFSNLWVKLGTAPGVGAFALFAFNQGSLVVRISDTDTEGYSSKSSRLYEQGDFAWIGVEASTSPVPATTSIQIGYMWTPANSTVGYPIACAMSAGTLESASTEYVPLMGVANNIIDVRETALIFIPVGGTIRNLYVDLNAAPGSGKSRTFTIERNPWTGANYSGWVDTGVTVTISDLDKSGSDLSNSINVVSRDLIVLKSVPTDSPASSLVRAGVCWEPTDGETFLWTANSDSKLPTSKSTLTRYFHALSGDYITNISESTDQHRGWSDGSSFEFTSMGIKLEVPPGAGNSYTLALRKNNADVISRTISGTLDVGFVAGQSVPLDHYSDMWNLKSVSTSFPVATYAAITLGARNVTKPTVKILGQTLILGQVLVK